MDYLYENLGDERFQEFCSTLISKEFPNMQAFPVGQPDGGRDTLAYFMESSKKQFIIFQVKFVRNPKNIVDPHKWLIEILKKEAPKIQKLLPNGAKEFYLLTNVEGTAHLDAGSKDKVNKILEENIFIPAQCWWRDDISRRFEKDPMFKWSFLEIISGQEVLNSLIFHNSNEKNINREAILNAYLSDQYRIDNEVKFKQIDLQNKLIDLYTDVPLRIKEFNHKDKKLRQSLEAADRSNAMIENDYYTNGIIHREEGLKAARFLLNKNIQYGIERILLEGGPGQGKSTISQYVCQVHRAKLLNKTIDLELFPDVIRKSPVRIPFKIDLRHIASWVEQKNPYSSSLNEDLFNQIWSKSLESFMIGHILYHSPSNDFKISDLHAIIKEHPILIVFDGFDEIADIKIRQEVFEFIDRGIERLKANTKLIQVLITSRPAAFSNAGGFPIDSYPHFELTDISLSCTREYVDKWIKANKLDSREGHEIKKLVEDKLQISHLRELAKSPMQLAIFISLLRTRGESLPNKRTALYDSYIDLFFNREAEKNQIIRDKRDLIIDIHKYLAWTLHSEAELLKNNGTINSVQLIDKLKKYLEKEGHSTDIADGLFKAMEERVCALVSRVQGTYEFEVQPLREYFCAKYLYETAPYSPAGNEKKGTKPERFNAIARDFYWNNVVRFYAGCFDKGELPMLVDELKDLLNDNLLKYTNYPRLLTSQLLSDWVFTQYPKYFKDVVAIIINGINIGKIINQNSRFVGSDEPILLSNECGRIEMIEECFEQLEFFPHDDYAAELIGLIVNNPHEKVLLLWEKELKKLPIEKTLQWLEYGYRMQLIYKISEDILLDTILNDPNESSKKGKIQILINGNRFDVINHNIQLKELALEGILAGEISAMPHRKRKNDSCLHSLSVLLHPYFVKSMIYEDNNGRFIDYLENKFAYRFENEKDEGYLIIANPSKDDVDILIEKLYNSISGYLDCSVTEWKKDIEKWDYIIEQLRDIFKDKWSFKVLSTIIAGVKGSNLIGEEYCDLSNDSLSLCKRSKYARCQSGNADYWRQQFDQAVDLRFVSLMCFTWATPRTIAILYEKLIDNINLFSKEDIISLSKNLSLTVMHNEFKKSQAKEMIDSLRFKSLPFEIQYLISARFPTKMREEFLFIQDENKPTIFNSDIIKSKFESLISKYVKNVKNVKLLEEIKACYELFPNCDINYTYMYHRYLRLDDSERTLIPIDIATSIMKSSKFYPRIIVSLAEKSCRLYANENVRIVGQIANDEKWFD